jgi:hypothetical protein
MRRIVSSIEIDRHVLSSAVGERERRAGAMHFPSKTIGLRTCSQEALPPQVPDSEEEHIDWLETQRDLIKEVGLQNYLQSQMS